MPGPTKPQLHVDRLLSNISIKYRNEEYIADQVFPRLAVNKSTDLYRVYERNFRLEATERASGGLANESGFDVSTASYSLEIHALKQYVSDDAARNWDISDLRADATEELTDKIARRKEVTTAALFTTTAWSLNVSLASGAAFTDNTLTSNPIPVYDTAATTIINNSGFSPNFGILPRDGFIGAKNHVSVSDRVKYTSREMTKEMLAALFSLPTLLVPQSSKDTSAPGLASVITPIWGDAAFVGYKPARPSPLVPSSGYMFELNQAPVRRWRDDERKSETIEVEMQFQPKVVASLAGYIIKGVS